jgi:hypothetical protein
MPVAPPAANRHNSRRSRPYRIPRRQRVGRPVLSSGRRARRTRRSASRQARCRDGSYRPRCGHLRPRRGHLRPRDGRCDGSGDRRGGTRPRGRARGGRPAPGWWPGCCARPVSWTRVVIAGVAATFLADLAARTLDDGRGEEGASDRVGRPGETTRRRCCERFGAGIAIAAGYASLLYPRLPGPPLLRGLAFGALEVAASRRGGLVRMAAETPGLRFPLQGLALPLHEDTGPAGPPGLRPRPGTLLPGRLVGLSRRELLEGRARPGSGYPGAGGRRRPSRLAHCRSGP